MWLVKKNVHLSYGRITAITCPTTAITTARIIRSHFCSKFIQSPIRSDKTLNSSLNLHSAFSFKPRIQYSATGHASARTMLLRHPRRHGNPEVALLSSQACTLVGTRDMESLRPNTELDLRHSHLTCLPESIDQLSSLT